MSVQVLQGDCIQVTKALKDNSVDSIVTDPPYELGFMGRKWDASGIAYNVNMWAECLRILKPGGHLLAFGGTRTYHRMACAIEDAGFEIRDSLHWIYGSGFPKSLDVSKAIDKAAGAEREVVGYDASRARPNRLYDSGAIGNIGEGRGNVCDRTDNGATLTAPATDAARQWDGWGTALKPAHEPVIYAQKPFNVVSLDWRLVANVHHALSGLLWLSLSPAKRAGTSSPSNPHEPREVMCVSAHVSVALDSSLVKSAKMDTFSSPALESTCWSIVSSWNSISGVLSDLTRMSTTSTASSMIIALRTLNSLLAPLTSQTTMPPCVCLLAGDPRNAENAGYGSSDEWLNWMHTLGHSVPETAGEGIALVVASALANIAEQYSVAREEGNTVPSPAPTGRPMTPGDSISDSANSVDEIISPAIVSENTALRDVRGSQVPASPAHEPIVVARKPLAGTVAANVLAYGTGALNVDGCRVETADSLNGGAYAKDGTERHDGAENWRYKRLGAAGEYEQPAGRWPPNILLDEEMAVEMDRQTGVLKSGSNNFISRSSADFEGNTGAAYGAESRKAGTEMVSYGDQGGASRFFPCFKYQAKAKPSERPKVDGIQHPTIKPVALMQWLVRLVTPPNGLVLDPFAGSGTTGEACLEEGFNAILIEREPDYIKLIKARLDKREPTLWD